MGRRKAYLVNKTRKHILNEIDKLVYLYSYPSETVCPDCIYDPVSQESSDSNCETCDGTGKILGDPKITKIKANLRNLQGESIIRRGLGNVVSDVWLMYCDETFKDLITSATKVYFDGVYYQSWLNDTGSPLIRKVSNLNGITDRIEVTLKRRIGEDS